MKNQNILIGTNWKMTKNLKEGREYVEKLLEVKKGLTSKIDLFIIPSFPHLIPIKQDLEGSGVKLGAQTMHWEDSGAYTGEVSPSMLSELELDLIELGHSERRQYYNENDIDVNKKALAAIRHQLQPLICIGEDHLDKDNEVGKERLREQLKIALKGVRKEDVKNVMIAYEPVWAIGENGVPAEPNYVAEQHHNIRALLVELYEEFGEEIPILYGGSVNLNNFEDYLKSDNVNGLFIGRAAWDMTSFKEILYTIDKNY
ncbi:triose-phosphate isomerase [Gracilibacillus sp. YIM 98692]|uniref:triose-phosphate isomerase n=1 Tax=Gracilibacillus sp. YIM 98692 TaxID=2663532 RepID=UPI0013D8986C|nr:triose-phosphate isomerase [Gracilibacillus sp. YIM 98692]